MLPDSDHTILTHFKKSDRLVCFLLLDAFSPVLGIMTSSHVTILVCTALSNSGFLFSEWTSDMIIGLPFTNSKVASSIATVARSGELTANFKEFGHSTGTDQTISTVYSTMTSIPAYFVLAFIFHGIYGILITIRESRNIVK